MTIQKALRQLIPTKLSAIRLNRYTVISSITKTTHAVGNAINNIDKISLLILATLVASLAIVGVQQYVGNKAIEVASEDYSTSGQITTFSTSPQASTLAQAIITPTATPTVTPSPTSKASVIPPPSPTGTVKTADPQNAATTAPNTYTVKAGDTLWNIAQAKYNSGYQWKKIADANKIAQANKITPGAILIIPPDNQPKSSDVDMQSIDSKLAVGGTELTTTPSARTYTVISGDTLWQIAQQEYNNPYLWTKIAQANNLANPNIIHPGNVFQIPPPISL